MNLRVKSALIAIGLYLPLMAHAQAPKGTADTAEIEEPEEELADEFAFLQMETEAMVETAARHSQPLAQSPSAITLLTREDIQDSGARVIPEAVRLVPNMDTYVAKPFWYEMNIRGIQSGQGIYNVLLLVDGRDTTLEFFGWPMWVPTHFSMDEVERIEVIRGPGSALYGANAFAGVVSVKTFTPGEGPAALASVRGGQLGEIEVGCRATKSLGSVALAASAGAMRQDLWTGRDVEGAELVRGNLGARIDLGSDIGLVLEAGGYRTAGKVHTSLVQVDLDRLVNLFGRARFSAGDLLIQAVYDDYTLQVDPNMFFAAGDIVLARVSPADGHLRKADLTAQHSLEAFFNRFTYGAQAVLNFYDMDILTRPRRNENRTGFFVQDEVDLRTMFAELLGADTGYLVLTAGLRGDYNSITYLALSPRASLVWAPNKNHSFRLGYGRAFLKPTFFEARMDLRLDDVSNLGFSKLHIDSSGLRHEIVDTLEAGYLSCWLNRRLQLNVNLAYNWMKDEYDLSIRAEEMDYRQIGTVSIPDLSGPGFFIGNSYSYQGHNAEIEVVVRPVEGLRLFGNVGYRQVFDEANWFVEREPIWRLAAGASLRLSGLSASAQVFYTSKRKKHLRVGNILEDAMELYLPSNWFINARVAWMLLRDPIKLTAGLEGFNLLGKRFREAAGTTVMNRPDFGGERLDCRIRLFLQGEL